ncbi:hypothetical protein RJ55_06206 [Drechmeria coniospora]|nr:hypothetical protein RJ55_06206 [Drechmeria coniospora]
MPVDGNGNRTARPTQNTSLCTKECGPGIPSVSSHTSQTSWHKTTRTFQRNGKKFVASHSSYVDAYRYGMGISMNRHPAGLDNARGSRLVPSVERD